MKGNNEIVLNTASMLEAVEFWLKECVLRDDVAFKVTSIQVKDNISGTYRISLGDGE